MRLYIFVNPSFTRSCQLHVPPIHHLSSLNPQHLSFLIHLPIFACFHLAKAPSSSAELFGKSTFVHSVQQIMLVCLLVPFFGTSCWSMPPFLREGYDDCFLSIKTFFIYSSKATGLFHGGHLMFLNLLILHSITLKHWQISVTLTSALLDKDDDSSSFSPPAFFSFSCFLFYCKMTLFDLHSSTNLHSSAVSSTLLFNLCVSSWKETEVIPSLSLFIVNFNALCRLLLLCFSPSQLTWFELWDLSLVVSSHSDHAVCRDKRT